MFAGTVPQALIEDLSRTVKLKVITVTEEDIIQKLEKIGFNRGVIPGGSYSFTPEDVPTVVNLNTITLAPNMDEGLVYHITKGIWENREMLWKWHPVYKRNLKPEVVREAVKNHGDLLHPAARKYYKEQGVIE
jgi:TRAP transporter TAXI family solute receptor